VRSGTEFAAARFRATLALAHWRFRVSREITQLKLSIDTDLRAPAGGHRRVISFGSTNRGRTATPNCRRCADSERIAVQRQSNVLSVPRSGGQSTRHRKRYTG